jgi:predicted transposase YbfD/YdcC
VLVVETFVDVAQFSGTVYSASGWSELGQTDGWGRRRRDYYVKHDQPKRLFCRPLFKNARRSLQAEHLKPALAVVEQKVAPPCTRTVKEIRSMVQHFKAVPDFRGRFESYPLWSMLTILFLATLCGAPRGQKDIAKFARGLSQAQRRALGIRRNRQGRYPTPTQPTFCRMLQRVDAAKVEQAILAIQEQMRGPAPKEQLIVLDGKEPRHGSGASILSAVTVPSQHYLGSALVDQKTNEIPVARELFHRLQLEERLVSLDALHTQDETARALVLEHGADYLLTVKGNQPTVRAQIEALVTVPQGDFPPSGVDAHQGSHAANQQKASREPQYLHRASHR